MPPNGPSVDDDAPRGFLSRWSRRKALVRQGAPVADPHVLPPAPQPMLEAPRAALADPALVDVPHAPTEVQAEAPPAPTLADVAALTQDSDFTRFVAPGVDTGVKNAALKKMFTAPHFNVMDGLDTYIDDYGQPDPLPVGMLRQMAQAHALGLFADEPSEPDPRPQPAGADEAVAPVSTEALADPVAPATLTPDLPQDPTPDENADLRLQPHDAAGPASPGPGPGPDAGGEHGRD